MSNALMRAARPLATDPTAKSVLMALCDMAREPDDPDRPCEAWPPMHGQDGALGLCEYTCFGERTVQQAIQRLVAAGLIDRRQRRHGVVYTVTLTPAGDAGLPIPEGDAGLRPAGDAGLKIEPALTPAGDAGRPAAAAPKASISTSSKKKRATPSPSTRNAFPMPEGVDPQHWRDFLANRMRKRRSNTASAHAKMMRELDRLTAGGWTIPQLIQHAAESGWAGIYEPKGQTDEQRSRTGGQPARGSTTNAYLEAFRRTGAGNEPLPD